MARFAPAALVAALLAATALAFVYTESLKLTPSPILGTRVLPKVISPVCGCPTDSAVIAFRLREADVVGVEMIDEGGNVVRHLVRRKRVPRGPVSFVWNGRSDVRIALPEGSYRPRVKLRRQHRTIVLPNPIRIDTTPPVVAMTRLAPRVFSPDGDARSDRVVVGYRVDEPSRISLYVNGKRAVLKKGRKTEGTIDWFGRKAGEPLPKGPYELRLGAVDIAGNEGRRTRAKVVVIRYVALGRIEHRGDPRRAVRRARADRCRPRDLEARGSHGCRAAWHAAAAGAGPAWPFHAHGDGERQQRSGRGVRQERGTVSAIGQFGSVLGCAGLALLCVAQRRDLRIAGLAAWALGLACLAAYLAPDLSPAKLFAAGAAGAVVSAAGGWALLRYPVPARLRDPRLRTRPHPRAAR